MCIISVLQLNILFAQFVQELVPKSVRELWNTKAFSILMRQSSESLVRILVNFFVDIIGLCYAVNDTDFPFSTQALMYQCHTPNH